MAWNVLRFSSLLSCTSLSFCFGCFLVSVVPVIPLLSLSHFVLLCRLMAGLHVGVASGYLLCLTPGNRTLGGPEAKWSPASNPSVWPQ